MPQSLVNSAPCLYTPPTDDGPSNMSDPEGLTFDLCNMITTLRRLIAFLEPVNIPCRLLKYLLGGKISLLLSSFILNILFLTLSEEAWLLLGLLCLFALATLGLLKRRSRRAHLTALEQRQGPHPSQQELALEIKALLRELDEMLSQACLPAERVHSLLCWGSWRDSALFYGGLMTVLYLLYTAPGSYTLVVTSSALVLWKGELHRVVGNMIFWRKSKAPEHQNEEMNTSPGEADLSWEDLEDMELDAECDFKDAIEDDDDDDDYDQPLIVRRGALVGAIPNLHQKRRKLAGRRRLPSSGNSGNCSRCHTSFNVLKKKKNCSNCGSSFCTRCCCKVQKSCLDPAAPEDQNMIVIVCTLCSVSLTQQA